MSRAVREATVPAYIFLCLVFGGSAQGIWSNLLLQLLAIALIGWALLHRAAGRLEAPARQVLAILGAGIVLALLHLVPLPPALWSALPGREVVATGFETLGRPLPWLPLSLAPYATMATLLTLLPPTAVLLVMLRLNAFRPAWLATAIALGTTASVALGVLQVSAPGADSPWYLYPFTNLGVATGFFANANHLAILLVITIPFLAVLMNSGLRAPEDNGRRVTGLAAAAAAIGLVVLVGIGINGSLAGIGLSIPVLIASSLLVVRRRGPAARLLLPAAGLFLGVAILVLFASSRSGLLPEQARGSIASRAEMASTSLAAAADFAPVGSGVGTFRQVYVFHENPDTVRRTFVNHAHNDYLEIAVEAGLPGLLITVVFLAWFAAAAIACWRSASAPTIARAATIAVAAVLAHSFVDYPLRTAAIASIFAMSLALMSSRKDAPARQDEGELRPSRHLTLDDIAKTERNS